jgi:glutamyl-tRNA synthetase
MTDPGGRVRVRLAPSPTGAPHVGTAYIGLFDEVFARHADGEFVLRIEDTDRERSTPESEAAILESLRWVGLRWDEGPDVGGPRGPYRQSERSDIYAEHARQLIESGAAYRCFCTRDELAARRRQRKAEGGSSFGYDRVCRDLPEDEVRRKLESGRAHVVRLKVPLDGETSFVDAVRGPVTVANAEIDDQVLLKSDGFPTYHLACVVDDRLMGITHVIRAEEWISSTPKHVLLYEAFGWEPPAFIHMPLLRNADKSKISKRKDPTSLLWYREQGYLPEALLNFLALMGWSLGEDREVFSIDEMVGAFSWERVKTSSPVFDLQKLDWLNGEYIRALSPEQLLERLLAEPFTRQVDRPAEFLLKIVRLAQERLKRLAEFDDLTAFFFAREPYEPVDLIPRKEDGAFVRTSLTAARGALDGVDDWTAGPMEATVRELAERLDCKRGSLYMVLRVAVTCRKVSTPLFETMEVLGKPECLSRIDEALGRASRLP